MNGPQPNLSAPSLGLIALTVAGIVVGSDLILQSPRSGRRASTERRLAPPILRDAHARPRHDDCSAAA